MSRPVSPEVPPALPPRAPRPATNQPAQAIPTMTVTPPAQVNPTTTTTPPTPTQQRQPTPTSAPTTLPPTTAPTTEPQTLREKLNAGDAHWQWKIGMRVVLVLIGLIGIGCSAWTVARYSGGYTGGYQLYKYELGDGWSMPWTLITFGLSVLWSAVCIIVFFTRRLNRPMHPGAQVGVDLIIWLAYIPTAMFAVLAVGSVMNFGSSGIIDSSYSSSSSDGYYLYVPNNNTWVWNVTQSSSYDNSYTDGRGRDCNSSSSFSTSYSTSSGFATCDEEDAYVNSLWQGKNRRFNTELTATVCQFMGLFLHLTLFIWACVDTNRRRSRNVSKEAEVLAAGIVMKMVKSGAVVSAPGAAQMRPMPPQMYQQQYPHQHPQQYQQYQQYYQQHYQQQYQQPYQQNPQQFVGQQSVAPQAAVASSSKEKGAGPRYA